MKQILIIILLSVSIAKETQAQVGVPDTLAYLQTIVANKSQYIGQPFSILLNNLQIQVKFFSPFASLPYNKYKETSTSFAFYFPQSTDDYYFSYPRLRVSWQSYLDANQSDILWKNNNGGGWTTAVANFYANAIISDIQIRE